MECNKKRSSVSMTAAPQASAPPEQVIDSEDLFRHGREVRIAHLGQYYTLRLTRENKLILTK